MREACRRNGLDQPGDDRLHNVEIFKLKKYFF